MTNMTTAVQTFLTQQLPTFETKQAAYLSTNGRYFQGLPTHASLPAHTDTATPMPVATQLASRPTDQSEDWLTFLPAWEGRPMPAMVRSDVYNGPQGKGYVLTLAVTYNGVQYRRAVHVGPEPSRGHDWAVIPAQITP